MLGTHPVLPAINLWIVTIIGGTAKTGASIGGLVGGPPNGSGCCYRYRLRSEDAQGSPALADR
jgi:hypothetical protein